MSFTSCFEKNSAKSGLAETKKAKSLSDVSGKKEQDSGQSSAGILTGVFGSEKEVDPDRFPAKNWLNSRIPG